MASAERARTARLCLAEDEDEDEDERPDIGTGELTDAGH
jgi:hypothetical protein